MHLQIDQYHVMAKERHKYKLIAELNNYQFKLVKAKRKFISHTHDETDEMFFVIEGHMKLETRDKVYQLEKGELIVVPKSVEHRPICDEEYTVMLVEPAGTSNTGNAGGPLTDNELEWI